MNKYKGNFTLDEFHDLENLGWNWDPLSDEFVQVYTDNDSYLLIMMSVRNEIHIKAEVLSFYSNRQIYNDLTICLDINQGAQYYHDIALSLPTACNLTSTN